MMKQGWEIKKLGEVCSLIADGDWIESRHQSDDGIRLIQTGNIGNGVFKAKDDKPHYISESTFVELGCTEIFAGDCLISRLPDPVGRACILPETNCRMITAVDCSIIRFNSDIVSKFFIYYTQCERYRRDIDNNTTGTTRKRISRKNLESITIPVPPREEQERFVVELDCLSGIIERKREQLRELDALAQSIFYQMFGDPITNEKGWKVNIIGNLAEFYNGVAHEGSISEDGQYDVINSKFISTQGGIRKHCDSQIFPLMKNDIVMVMSDVPNGKALAKCYLIETNDKYTLNQRICAFRNYNCFKPIFLYYYLNRHPYYLRFDDGNGQTNLRKNDVLNCPVYIPPLTLQQEFADKIEAIEKQKELIKQSITQTETLFNSRMAYYFN